MYKAALIFHDLFALTCEIDHIFNSYNLICNKISEYHEFYKIYTGVLKMNPVVLKHKKKLGQRFKHKVWEKKDLNC